MDEETRNTLWDMFVDVAKSVPGVEAAGNALAKEISRYTSFGPAKNKLRRDYANRSDEEKRYVNEKFEETYMEVYGCRPSSPVFDV